MSWGKQVKQIVTAVAPTLGTALAGPLGGAAMAWITKELGGGDSKKAADAIMSSDPDTLLALRKVETDFRSHMAELGLDESRLEIQDRADARGMAVSSGNVWVPAVLAAAFVVAWFGIQCVLLFHVVPDGNREILVRTMGTLDVSLGGILAYYFGSSHGSQTKNEIVSKLAARVS